MIQQQLSLSEPTRIDDGLIDFVYGSQDIKFIIKSYPIPNKLKQYNHMLAFEKLLKNGFIKLVSCHLEKDDKIISIRYSAVELKDTELREQLMISVRNPDGNISSINFNHWNITAYDENSHRKMYVTDAYGRIVNVLEYNNDPVLKFNFETDTYTTSYNYDTADDLIKITDALGNNFIFGYDSLGRRISLQDPDLGNWSYTYDLIGNLVSQKQMGGGNLVTGDGYYREYNELNQLIKIRNGSAVTAGQLENYTYDPFGQRVKVMRNDSANTTIYTPFKELMRIVNSSGTYDFTYVYDGNTLLARVNPDGSKWYYHPDHLGSTSLITDQNGNVVENTFYSPYGELLGGGTSDVKLYTGQFSDSSTNQYYYGARYYKPSTGQFISPDTIISQMYNPQSLNRYSYVLGNPYKYFDPNGKEPIKSQLGSVDAITNYIVTLEKSNPNAKPTEILNMIVANTGTFESRPDWFGSGYPNDARYLYTKDKGFVDTYHFFANAELVRTIEGSTLPILDYWQEFGQYRSSSDKISGFSYEDIPSNRLGRLFGNSVTNDKTLSQQFSQFMQNIGASSNPLSDAESQHPGLLSTLPENEPTDRSNLLPESKRCFFCVGPALPSEFKPSFIDRIGTGIGNFFGGIFK